MIERPEQPKLITSEGKSLAKLLKEPVQLGWANPRGVGPVNDTELRNGLKVEKSKIEGMGLFADRVFKQYEVIWFEKLKGRGANPENGGPLRWANHSDSPNAALVLTQTGLFEVSLVATRDIKQHEEITYNYGVFGHAGHRAECNCGEPNCKGFFTLRVEWGEKK
ncbi:MAG: SET domain-containing protein-lysine N-methyltransferase [Candidatus Thorarchaeota archaeon]|jgi:hypothetical protein